MKTEHIPCVCALSLTVKHLMKRKNVGLWVGFSMAVLPLFTGCHEATPDIDADEPLDLPEASGRWLEIPEGVAGDALSDAELEEISRLQDIGYMGSGVVAPSYTGVTRHDPAQTEDGFNFYAAGHDTEAILTDMEGNVLHRWSRSFEDIWPTYPVSRTQANAWFWAINNNHTAWWRRAHLFENGDILIIFEGLGIAKLDKESNIIWANPCKAHHDLEVMPDGTIYTLTREAHVIPRIHPEELILEDYVSILDADGNELRRISLIECFENSEEYSHIWESRENSYGDVLHTNTVRVLDGRFSDRLPAFQAGRILTSMRSLHAIAVVDIDQEEVVWAQQGSWRYQHDPRMLEDGNILLFDNRGHENQSTVYKIDPLTMEEVWAYRGTEEHPLYTEIAGLSTQLPNGNILVTESDKGRAIEVTKDKEIVWEFWNPHRTGPEGRHIASLFEMVRLPPDFPVEWAKAPPSE